MSELTETRKTVAELWAAARKIGVGIDDANHIFRLFILDHFFNADGEEDGANVQERVYEIGSRALAEYEGDDA